MFKPQRVELSRAVALSGIHGSGKTLLLRMIEAAFGYTWQTHLPPRMKSSSSKYTFWEDEADVSGIVEVAVRINDQTIVRTVDLSEGPERRKYIWPWKKDPPDGSPALGEWWPEFASPVLAIDEFGVLFSGSLPNSIAKVKENSFLDMSLRDRAGLRAILGVQFDSIKAYEVDTAPSGTSPYYTPFFVATAGGQEMTGLSFSLSQLWVSYLFWFLHRRAIKGSVVLIDEPEAFVAERGHRTLVDEIARIALQQDLQVLLATHSAGVLSRFPLQTIRLASGPAGAISVKSPSSMAQLKDSVGIVTSVKAIALVEDRLAAAILKAILADNDLALSREIDVVAVGGKDNVIAGCRILRASRRVPVFGVLDGDMRSEVDAQTAMFYLPGSETPEHELLNSAADDIEALGALLRRSAHDIEIAISDLRHLDHQYFLVDIARRIGHEEAVVQEALITIWLGRSETAIATSALMQQIRAVVSAAS